MVVEFNCRLGDPETQVVLPLVDGDLLDLFERAAGGSLAGVEVTVKAGHAACVVLAAPGYPGSYPVGSPISGVDAVPDDVIVFQAGTRRDDDGRLITSGGRVLGVVGTGVRLEDALSRAYAGVEAVSFDGMQFRSDIGRRGLAAEAGAVVANR
jgi:phosphoribosylamine--glycine ligase